MWHVKPASVANGVRAAQAVHDVPSSLGLAFAIAGGVARGMLRLLRGGPHREAAPVTRHSRWRARTCAMEERLRGAPSAAVVLQLRATTGFSRTTSALFGTAHGAAAFEWTQLGISRMLGDDFLGLLIHFEGMVAQSVRRSARHDVPHGEELDDALWIAEGRATGRNDCGGPLTRPRGRVPPMRAVRPSFTAARSCFAAAMTSPTVTRSEYCHQLPERRRYVRPHSQPLVVRPAPRSASRRPTT